MQLRGSLFSIGCISLFALGGAAIACAASGGTDEPEDAASEATTAPPGPPTQYDSGPPASPYGNDAAPDAALGDADTGEGGEGGPPVNTACNAPGDCPGNGEHDTVKCDSHKCDLSCQGEFYDVNGLPSDGCEVPDVPIDKHTQTKAIDQGSFSCNDGSSTQNIDGRVPSDVRVHENPTFDGFNTTVGAAPDWFKIGASGGVCTDDANFDLQMNNVKQKNCYRLTLITNKQTQACGTDSNGHCSIGNGAGSYSDGSTIYLTVEKLLDPANGCPAGVSDNAEYHISGHL
jgi:hypothetical protein